MVRPFGVDSTRMAASSKEETNEPYMKGKGKGLAKGDGGRGPGGAWRCTIAGAEQRVAEKRSAVMLDTEDYPSMKGTGSRLSANAPEFSMEPPGVSAESYQALYSMCDFFLSDLYVLSNFLKGGAVFVILKCMFSL